MAKSSPSFCHELSISKIKLNQSLLSYSIRVLTTLWARTLVLFSANRWLCSWILIVNFFTSTTYWQKIKQKSCTSIWICVFFDEFSHVILFIRLLHWEVSPRQTKYLKCLQVKESKKLWHARIHQYHTRIQIDVTWCTEQTAVKLTNGHFFRHLLHERSNLDFIFLTNKSDSDKNPLI